MSIQRHTSKPTPDALPIVPHRGRVVIDLSPSEWVHFDRIRKANGWTWGELFKIAAHYWEQAMRNALTRAKELLDE